MALNEFIQKMMVGGQLDWGEGVIKLLGLRAVFLPAPTFVQFLLRSNKKVDVLLKNLYEVGVWHGKELVMKAMGENLLKIPKEQLLFQFGSSSNVMGLGKWEWIEFNPDSKRMLVRITDSIFVDQFKQNKVKTKAACAFIVGVCAGIGEVAFNGPVEAKEMKCAISGSGACEILVQGKKSSSKKKK